MPGLRASEALAHVQNKYGIEWSDEYQLGPLDGVYAKLDQARLHARALEASVTKVLDANRDFFEREIDGTRSKYRYRAVGLPEIDPDWSLQLGDFLTNLRAALDHLAWQLVLLDGKEPDEFTSFPIHLKAVNKKGNPSLARIPQITSEHIIQAVEAVQPYLVVDRGLYAEDDLLYALNTLVIIDKHRLLLTTFHGVAVDKAHWFLYADDPRPKNEIRGGRLREGDEFAWFDFEGKPAPKYFDPHLELQVFLNDIPGNRPLMRRELLAYSKQLFIHISDQVIARHFAHLFDETPRYYGHSFDAKLGVL